MFISYIPNITLSWRFWKFCVSTRTFIFKSRYLSSRNLRCNIRLSICCCYKTSSSRSYGWCSKWRGKIYSCTTFSCRNWNICSSISSTNCLNCSICFSTLSGSSIICIIKICNLSFSMRVRGSSFACKSISKSRYFRLCDRSNTKCYCIRSWLCNSSTIAFISYSSRNSSDLFISIFLSRVNSI